MPRPPRIEYPGAIYHVINRGNYRWDVFGSPGAAKAFLKVVEETVKRFGWELGAFVVMRNHFHLAVRTPEPNLSAGMHWLQTTFATRFNRIRHANGHLFQGRYKAILLQNAGVWARVIDYIHLNPVRAKVVEPQFIKMFRWSSLRQFVQGARMQGLTAVDWLATHGLTDDTKGWSAYAQQLIDSYRREKQESDSENVRLSGGWAIGDDDWRTEIAQKHRQKETELNRSEFWDPQEAQHLRWEQRFVELLKEKGRTESDLPERGRGTRWKIQLADQHQRELGSSIVWLADRLGIPKPATLRTALWRLRSNVYK
jgi:REP element-mobilizing transposase RayT